ncbi:MAG: thioredoxin family protein [candidate division KSB1 bacterium]|nr:thioredoxin family protein [candidate division KSB1 bacterium]
MKRCKIIYPLAILLLLQIGCSEKTQEEPVAKTEAQTLSPDTSSKDVKKDSVLVTFIELGSVKCIPCKMMQPIMDEIETEYAGQVKVVFHDVWTKEGQPYAQKYGIRAIPTQVFLDKEGNEYFRHEGFFPKKELVKVLEEQGVK